MANYAPKAQQVANVPYRLNVRKTETMNSKPALDTEPVETFAQQWRQENKGKWIEIDLPEGGFMPITAYEVPEPTE